MRRTDVERPLERGIEQRRRQLVVGVRAAGRLRHDLVDDRRTRSRSGAVSFSASAASTLRFESRHRIAAHPSGGITL